MAGMTVCVCVWAAKKSEKIICLRATADIAEDTFNHIQFDLSEPGGMDRFSSPIRCAALSRALLLPKATVT